MRDRAGLKAVVRNNRPILVADNRPYVIGHRCRRVAGHSRAVTCLAGLKAKWTTRVTSPRWDAPGWSPRQNPQTFIPVRSLRRFQNSPRTGQVKLETWNFRFT